MRLGHKIIGTILTNVLSDYIQIVDHEKVAYNFFGGDCEEATPVPIPNTEVKLFSADGTAWEAVWESRTLPKIFYKPGTGYQFRVFYLFNPLFSQFALR